MKIPKYIKGIIERAEFELGYGYPGYTIRIHKATDYQFDDSINNEAERLVAFARRNGAAAYVNKYVRGTHYCDQYVIVTVFDPVMKYIEEYMNYSRNRRYDSFKGILGNCMENVFGEIYCSMDEMESALDNIHFC